MESFPNSQFQIDGYRLFRKDRDCHGGGLCLYVNENVACKQIHFSSLENIESICIEIKLRKRKWLVIGLYKPPAFNEQLFLENLSMSLDHTLENYENIILLGDFKLTPKHTKLLEFTDTFNLKHLIKEPTCFKGANPAIIDLILTNQRQYFKNSKTFETGISDFHKLTTTVLKSTFVKGNPKT